jgi:hypothetical protein
MEPEGTARAYTAMQRDMEYRKIKEKESNTSTYKLARED